MNRLITVLIMCIVLLCACQQPASNTPEYTVQYIRTNGYVEGVDYPYTVVINSIDELRAYIAANEDTYDFSRKEKGYSDTTIGFLDAVDKYDDTYFETSLLILVVLEEGSGSIRHEVTSVDVSPLQSAPYSISIKRITPELGTADMAEWHIIVEVEKGTAILQSDSINVTFQ